MMRQLLSLGRDTAGAAVIEIALAAPLLAAFLIGMSEISTGYSTKLQLEQAAQTAIEKVMQGSAYADSTSATSLRTEAATLAGVDESNVSVTYYLECDGTLTTPYSSVCSATQVSRRYVKISITKSYVPWFATKYAGANADGSYTLTGKTQVRVQ